MHNLPKNNHNQPILPSKYTQSLDQGSSVLYDAVNKKIRRQPCRVHDLNVEYFYNQTLLCEICFQKQLSKIGRMLSVDQVTKYQHFYHLKQIMNYPMILLAQQQSLFEYPIHIIDLLLKSYQPLYSKNSDFSAQKQLLNAFIIRIKNRVNSLCDQLIACFSKAEQNLTNIRCNRDEMKDISKMYQQHFLELLQEKYKEGSVAELQSVLKDFASNNVNPFDKIFNNLDQVMSYLSQSPIININELVKLYTTVTDQQLWKVESIVSSKEKQGKKKNNNQLIIMNNTEIILQSQYAMQIKQNCLTLFKDNTQIDKLDAAFDSIYHYSKYRLIGVNYDSIQIISYFDRLNVDEVYRVQGCTDLLSFNHHIVAITNQNLVKIDLIQKTQSILGENYSELQYISKDLSTFSCVNGLGKRIQWSLLSNQQMEIP